MRRRPFVKSIVTRLVGRAGPGRAGPAVSDAEKSVLRRLFLSGGVAPVSRPSATRSPHGETLSRRAI